MFTTNDAIWSIKKEKKNILSWNSLVWKWSQENKKVLFVYYIIKSIQPSTDSPFHLAIQSRVRYPRELEPPHSLRFTLL